MAIVHSFSRFRHMARHQGPIARVTPHGHDQGLAADLLLRAIGAGDLHTRHPAVRLAEHLADPSAQQHVGAAGQNPGMEKLKEVRPPVPQPAMDALARVAIGGAKADIELVGKVMGLHKPVDACAGALRDCPRQGEICLTPCLGDDIRQKGFGVVLNARRRLGLGARRADEAL